MKTAQFDCAESKLELNLKKFELERCKKNFVSDFIFLLLLKPDIRNLFRVVSD